MSADIYGVCTFPNGTNYFHFPISVESLLERGCIENESDFDKGYDCMVCDELSNGSVNLPDGATVEDFNRAARALENAVGCFGNELSFLYREVYHTREMMVANLEELTEKVVEVCGAATYEGLAEHYIAMGAFGELSDDLYKWLDLYKMGDSIAVKDKLIRGFHGFYKVRE